MAGHANKDALHPCPLGEGQLNGGNPSLSLFVLSALVKVLVVQAPPHQCWRSHVMIVLLHSSHGSIDGEEVKMCQKEK